MSALQGWILIALGAFGVFWLFLIWIDLFFTGRTR